MTSINFYCLSPPVTGDIWIDGTNAELLGHAYRASTFQAPGEEFEGLKMGDYLIEASRLPIVCQFFVTVEDSTGKGVGKISVYIHDVTTGAETVRKVTKGNGLVVFDLAKDTVGNGEWSSGDIVEVLALIDNTEFQVFGTFTLDPGPTLNAVIHPWGE